MEDHQPPLPPQLSLPRNKSLPAMVLVDRCVRFVDEVLCIIQETGGLPPDRVMELAPNSSKSRRRLTQEEEYDPAHAAMMRYLEEVQKPAYEILRERKAASASAAAVRKEPVTFTCDALRDLHDAAYLREMLDGIEPCLSSVADAPGVTSLSLKISWPPIDRPWTYPDYGFISSCHRSLLLLYVGSYRPGNREPGFYLVYNTRANSVAVVPPISGVSSWSHYHMARGGGGVAVLCLDADNDYVLAELLPRRNHRGRLTTNNKATLFLWSSLASCSGQGQWIPTEVELPLPGADQASAFRADMVFAVGSTSICWVDLVTGILVYNHTAAAADNDNNKQTPLFHFIPLPPDAMDTTSKMTEKGPEEYRSMCCINGETLKFVSMDGYNKDQGLPMSEVRLTTWILSQPLSPNKWQWTVLQSVRIRDFWHNPWYDDLPFMPSFPVISTIQPDVIYVTVINYKYNREREVMEATELYVLSLDMHRRSVVRAFKATSDENGIIPPLLIFTSHFTSYLNQTMDDLYEECPRGKEVADVRESRNNPAAWTSVWISSGEEAAIPTKPPVGVYHPTVRESTPYIAAVSRRSVSLTSPVAGLQCVLDEPPIGVQSSPGERCFFDESLLTRFRSLGGNE